MWMLFWSMSMRSECGRFGLEVSVIGQHGVASDQGGVLKMLPGTYYRIRLSNGVDYFSDIELKLPDDVFTTRYRPREVAEFGLAEFRQYRFTTDCEIQATFTPILPEVPGTLVQVASVQGKRRRTLDDFYAESRAKLGAASPESGIQIAPPPAQPAGPTGEPVVLTLRLMSSDSRE
jgi:hypothetical protein